MSATAIYNLEDRCLMFAKDVKAFISILPRSISNNEYIRQIARSSSSIGANYIEAREAESTKDFVHKIKIARKEAKETHYWLQLVTISEERSQERDRLSTESIELLKILSVIAAKVQAKAC